MEVQVLSQHCLRRALQDIRTRWWTTAANILHPRAQKGKKKQLSRWQHYFFQSPYFSGLGMDQTWADRDSKETVLNMHNTNNSFFTQSTVFIVPGQSLQKNILSYLKGHQRFCFQILSLWILQLEAIIWANNKQNRIPEINKHRQNDFQFTHFWVLHIYDDFTLSLNYTAPQFLMHRYASKYGINSEEYPWSDVQSRLFP